MSTHWAVREGHKYILGIIAEIFTYTRIPNVYIERIL